MVHQSVRQRCLHSMIGVRWHDTNKHDLLEGEVDRVDTLLIFSTSAMGGHSSCMGDNYLQKTSLKEDGVKELLLEAP